MLMQGTRTTGRLPKDAMLSMVVTAGTLLGGISNGGSTAFASIATADIALPHVLAKGAMQGAELFAASARLRNMMGEVIFASPKSQKAYICLPYYGHVPIMAPPSDLLGFCFKNYIWGIDRKVLPSTSCLPQKEHSYVMRANSYVTIRQM
jgi:hypothetical protein